MIILFASQKDCRYGIPFTNRKHHWELYGAVIIEFKSAFVYLEDANRKKK